MALNQAQAEQLINLVAAKWPTNFQAHRASRWALPAIRTWIAPADLATFDSLVAGLTGSQASVVAAAGAAVAAASG
jgi:hypothetical protein